jgi:hypothetical protein
MFAPINVYNAISNTDFLGFVQSQLDIFNVSYYIPITYPLHVSAPMGHLQVDYMSFLKELSYYNRSVVPIYILLLVYRNDWSVAFLLNWKFL